ncbi:hypothetical protein ACT517_17295 [Pseudomonas aeruginosa]|uniref:hypothetical protein n=1 Tax=Pseudomonas aeruginosa TaxID=287 RepID=UPI001F1BB707|nr:hypothetical protein [Pseudomonas aeruginosa]MCF1245197.1 hypothetical protein [Pseudomonas aeruginosa]
MSEVKRFDVPSMRSLQGEQAVMGYEVVLASDYDTLAAEAQALREEVAALRMARDDFKLERDLARQNFCDEQAANYQLQAHFKSCLGELSELRARVAVVPERELFTQYLPGAIPRNADEVSAWKEGWNACLDELARLNGKTVSEGLLRQLLDSDGIDGIFDAQQNYAAHQELRALLSEQEGGKQ